MTEGRPKVERSHGPERVGPDLRWHGRRDVPHEPDQPGIGARSESAADEPVARSSLVAAPGLPREPPVHQLVLDGQLQAATDQAAAEVPPGPSPSSPPRVAHHGCCRQDEATDPPSGRFRMAGQVFHAQHPAQAVPHQHHARVRHGVHHAGQRVDRHVQGEPAPRHRSGVAVPRKVPGDQGVRAPPQGELLKVPDGLGDAPSVGEDQGAGGRL